MALNEAILKANKVLEGLTAEQLSAIVTLSQNDENAVIGTKIGELHGRYDEDVLSVTGVAKKQGEKSYDYVKRILGEFKTQVEASAELSTKIDALAAEKTALEKQIKDGSLDAATKQKLTDTETRLAQLQAKYDADKAAFEQQKGELESRVKGVHVDYAFAQATAGMAFKAGIPESVQSVLIDNARREILATATPEVNEKGELVFRGKDGNVLNNPENKLNPFTAKEMLLQTTLRDVIETTPPKPGTGTKPLAGGSKGLGAIDLSGVKTQVDADDAIGKHLATQGLVRGTAEFAEQQSKIRTEAEVDKLPMR